MAAVTVASGPVVDTIGNKRRVSVQLTAPNDGDTWATPLVSIDDVMCSFNTATAAAADAVTLTTSGGTVTFHVAGTARNLAVIAVGN